MLACSRLAEPRDHAIGRSRGGLTSKLHTLVDGKGRPLVLVVSAGQVHDSPVLPTLLDQLHVPRIGAGRPRHRPDTLIADKAYSSRGHRARLRAAKVKTVIPEPADQIAHRKRRGTRGGRPPAFDAELYRHRNVIERSYNTIKQWRGLATRYDNHALHWRGAAVLRATLIWVAALGDTP